LHWKSPVRKPDNYLVSVENTDKKSSKDIIVNMNDFRNFTKRETIIKYLEDCAVYQIKVYSQVYGQLVNPCQLKYMQLKDSVKIDLDEVSANSVVISIKDQKQCFQSSYEYFYSELKEERNKKSVTQVISKNFTITDLKPNTTYQLNIRQNYMDRQYGNYTVYNFTTKIIAPRNAPVFYVNKTSTLNLYEINWKTKNNRKVSLYKIKITNNKLWNNFKEKNCTKLDAATTVCVFYHNTTRSYFNLSDTSGVQLSACLVDENKVFCSKWSESKLVTKARNIALHDAVWIVPVMILGAVLFIIFSKTITRETNVNVEPKINSEVLESIQLTQNNQDKFQPITNNEDELIETLDEWRENLKNGEIQPSEPTNRDSPTYVITSEIPSVKTAEYVDLMTSPEYRGSAYDATDDKTSEFLRHIGGGTSDGADIRLLENDDVETDVTASVVEVPSSEPADGYVNNFGSMGRHDDERLLLPFNVNAYVGEDMLR